MEELGKFELPVLAAVARLRGDGYGVTILEAVAASEGRDVAYGAVHVTLDRLVAKGLVDDRMGEPTAQRGGRRKRFFEITAKGQRALVEARSRQERQFAGLGWLGPEPARA